MRSYKTEKKKKKPRKITFQKHKPNEAKEKQQLS